MAITFLLVERTPYTLRYLATSDGQETVDVDSGYIPNVGFNNWAPPFDPDLSGNAETAGEPMRFLVNKAVANQADARELLNGDGLLTGGIDGNLQSRMRGRLSIMSCTDTTAMPMQWAVDADNIGGRAVIRVVGPNLQDAEAYVELHARHSVER